MSETAKNLDNPENHIPRKKFLTERSFQLALISYSLVMAIAVIVSTYFGVFSFFRISAHQALDMGLGTNPLFQQFVNQEEKSVMILFALNAVIIIAFMGLFGLFLSHRVAGPLSRVKMQLKKLADGEKTSAMTFRKNDYFQDLSDYINKISNRLK